MDPSDEFTPPPSAFRKRSTSWAGIGGLVLLLGLLGGVGYWFYRSEPEVTTPLPLTRPTLTDAGSDKPDPALASDNGLPKVDASDDYVRSQASNLSPDPHVAQWMKTPGLIRRLVAGIADVSDGESPRGTLSFLIPAGEFSVIERHGRTFADPASFSRYDVLGHAVESVDARAAAAGLKRVEPLCAAVWQEIGPPGSTFQAALTSALQRLSSAQVNFDDPALVPKGASGWAFSDPVLEARSPLEKQLFRLGPENAARLQRKAQELQKLLVIPAPAASPPTSEVPPEENASP